MAWNIRTSRTLKPDLEILVNQVNVDVAASVVLDASTFPLDSDGNRTLVAGTPLVKNLNNQYQAYSGAASHTVQTLVIDATSGTLTLTHGADTTDDLDFDLTSSDL